MTDAKGTFRTPRACMFCGGSLAGRLRAKEHVFKKAWLEKLGHMKTGIHSMSGSKGGVVSLAPNVAAGAVQTGEVCSTCNSGWMCQLDESVDHVIKDWAQFDPADRSLSELDRDNLARCLLLKACVLIYTDPPERRHVPRKILDGVQQVGFVPDGFFMFCQRSHSPNVAIGGGSIDAWPDYGCIAVGGLPQSRRMKFAVMYDNVILGFAWVDVEELEFQFMEGYHEPLLTKNCRLTPVVAPSYAAPIGLIDNAATRLGVTVGVRLPRQV